MLLIAVTGPVGAGKTSLLRALAEEERARGKRVDGFVALAEGRAVGGRGAERYDLLWLAAGEQTPFAVRDERATPPYRFDPAAARVQAWADGLSDGPPAHLVVLDEFGRVEADGGGHAASWPAVAAAHPDVVAVAVRDGLVDAVATRLGQPFDVVVRADEPGAIEKLRAACRAHDDWTRVGLYGAGAGGIEVTVGSVLHAGQVPLRGLALSTTQAVVMAHAGDGLGRRGRVVWVPFVAAGLKALSPAGNRLRPMLAITAQGLLFGAATRLLGWNRAGLSAAGALVGAWAGAQGFFLQYLLVGEGLLQGYEAVAAWTAERGFGLPGLIVLLGLWVGTWAVVAGGVTAWAWRRTSVAARVERALARGAGALPRVSAAPTLGAALVGAARDLVRPSFWAPVLIVAAIVVAAGQPWERGLWIALRAATVGLVLFALARRVDPARIARRLRRRGHWGPAEALDRALGRRPSGYDDTNSQSDGFNP